MRSACLLLFVAVTAATASVTAYHIEPRTAAMSGKARGEPQNGGVSQTVRCCWDSLERVELFAGARGSSGHYLVTVYDGITAVTWSDGTQYQNESWVRFENWDHQVAFTKGKDYRFRFSRGWNDSIQYYFDDDPYKFGHLIVGQQEYPGHDLACRVFGRMDTLGADWLSVQIHASGSAGALAMAKNELGVTWVGDDLGHWNNWVTDSAGVRRRCLACVAMGFQMRGYLAYGNPNDSFIASAPPGTPVESLAAYPPRNLFPESVNDSNYWSGYCHSIMARLDTVKYWTVWGEPNACWNWRDPDTQYYGSPDNPIDTPRERCSLYVRMCQIAKQAAESLHYDQKIVGGYVYRLLDPDGLSSTGVDWLRDMFDLADEECFGGVENCFDIVAADPYMHKLVSPGQDTLWFDPAMFDTDLDTARAVMRAAGYPDMELWVTEMGWPKWYKSDTITPYRSLTDTLMQARNLCQFLVSALGRQADPRGGYDRVNWYELTSQNGGIPTEGFGLLDTTADLKPLSQWWSAKQVGDQLKSKRLNGRAMTGDSAVDTLVRVYEFEDPASLKKTWVCWRNGPDNSVVSVKFPARSDTSAAASLDYEGDPQSDAAVADANGWVSRGIYARPMFITEPDERAISRPELVAESLWISPLRSGGALVQTVYVKIKNRDSQRATPGGCAVQLTWNDSIVASICGTAPIDANETKVESLAWQLPEWFHGEGLLKANVNPGMSYVEREGTDDNQAYQRLVIRGAIGGTLAVAAPPGGKTDAPLLVCDLASMSYEKDSTGQEPADSARVLFAWYGAHGDSVVHATDTTAWFSFCADTVLQYPRGCGVYRVYAQYRDSGASDSPFYGDSTDSIVVFDSVPPAGSIVVEGGRFASNSTRTLHLTASDSASGVCDMRFMNRGRANLARNGAFDPVGGCWSFTGSGCGYDTSLQLGKLSVGPTQTTVRQFVPAESISAYSGDSCVLEASILAHVHDGEATGDVSFWFYHIRVDSLNLHDTLWALVDSACYSGDLLSLTGRYNLSTRFLLSTATPESGWVWRGGMVRVRAQGVDGSTGNVWCDNVGMNAYEPQAGGYAWWGQYDSTAQWDIGSSAGQHVVGAVFIDSAGSENAVPYADTVILDPTPPVVDISLPMIGQLVNGLVEITGVAYDTIEVPGDTWFQRRTLSYRHSDSSNWLPVDADSVSSEPAWPDSMSSQGPAVHLGYWNTLGLEDGTYYLLLTASDSAGNTSSCTTWVMVDQGFGGGGMCGGPEGGGTGMGEGSCYVGSAEGHVLHLSDDLTVLDTFSVSDSGSQAYVTSILEVGNDSLLVLDAANKRIHKLHRGGQHRRRLVSGLSQPADLKQDTNGNFWLADRGWNRIGKFRSNGTLVFVRGGLGADSLHFRSPEGIAVKGGLVYVADGGNNRIAVWDTSGHFKTTITGDFENPTAVWVMESGAIYLTDGTDGKLKGITPLGGNIVTIGTTDSSKLKGLVPSENRHNLFSLASEPNKVYKLRIQSDESRPGGQQSAGKVMLPKTLSLAQPFPNPARTRLNIAYALPRRTRVVLKLYDVAGKLVTTLTDGQQKPGYYSLTWNRQDSKGRSCACGVYFCTLAAENQHFSRKVILTE